MQRVRAVFPADAGIAPSPLQTGHNVSLTFCRQIVSKMSPPPIELDKDRKNRMFKNIIFLHCIAMFLDLALHSFFIYVF